MSKLFEATNTFAVTQNGAVTNASTLSATLDFFGLAGGSRGKDISHYFLRALAEDKELAVRTLLYTRDIREGNGERQTFKDLIPQLIGFVSDKVITNIINLIPEIGRFDDLEAFVGTKYEEEAFTLWVNNIKAGNALAAKFAPRKDKKGAKALRKIAGLNEEQWRKFVVQHSDTVEQKMCAGKWDDISFGKLPSLASARYSKVFNRHAPEKYQAYLESLVKGEAKVNAGAVYPYDVIKALRTGAREELVNAQWLALPDLLVDCKERILPVIDVSGSMESQVGGNPNLQCKDVAISLGMYIAERNTGVFKDEFISFSSNPNFHTVKGNTLKERYNSLDRSGENMSTDLFRVFKTLLSFAVNKKLTNEDLPSKLLIISDMEFDYVDNFSTNFEVIKKAYTDASYEIPQLVFWRVDVKEPKNQPVTIKDNGTAIISGFSINNLKTVFGDLNPVSTMLKTIMVDRYNVFD